MSVDRSSEAAVSIKSAKDFDDTPEGWYKRWQTEMVASKEFMQPFHDKGRIVVDRYRAKRDSGVETLVNLFPANAQTIRAFLYGKTPSVDVKRRWGDPHDVIARCGAEMLQRLLNTDLMRYSDSFVRTLKYALLDRLLPGLGFARLHYRCDTEKKKIDPIYKLRPDGEKELDESTGEAIMLAQGYTSEEKTNEDVEIEYVHWEDVRWNAGCRVYEEARWFAFRCPMTQDELIERFEEPFKEAFGEKEWKSRIKDIPLNSDTNKDDPKKNSAKPDPWQRADVWEIHDKENRKIWWWVDGFPEILDDEEDPLKLDGFWSFPMPMMANLTTSEMLPIADYVYAQDLYNEVDEVSFRIKLLQRAVAVRGVYNSTCKALIRLLEETTENELIPVDEWPLLKEGGGLKGNIEWLPLEMIVAALDKLREYRKELIQLLYQVTGMSDILRGEASQQATATEQAIKAKFASVRLQDFQDEFARFASDIQRLKAEIISKLFDPQTIIDRSNVEFTPDAQYAQPAVEMIQQQFIGYRIEVKSETMSVQDYATLKQERVEIMGALSQFLQTCLQIGGASPAMLPYLLEIVKWAFTGFRGGSAIEGVLDQAIQKATEMALAAANAPPKQDPKVEAEKIRAQAEEKKSQMDVQTAQLDHQQKREQIGMEMQQANAEHQISMQKNVAQMRMEALRAVTKTIPSADSGAQK